MPMTLPIRRPTLYNCPSLATRSQHGQMAPVSAPTYHHGIPEPIDPSAASTVVPVPDATIMKRLGYIRLLHHQAVTQSHAPAPLNFSSVLALHDVLEYFFIVALAHLGNRHGLDLKSPFVENAKKFRAPDGGRLFGLDGVHRIGHDRNGFKHNGSVPGVDQVEQARRDAATFLEGNCPRLFGLEFTDISMLHIVPQEPVREHLQAGRTAADNGQLDDAMAEVAMAFDQLIADWGRGKYLPGSAFLTETFSLQAAWSRPNRRVEAFPTPSDQGVRSAMSGLASSVKEALEGVDKELETIRNVLRIQISGVEMAQYARFAMIAPEISMSMNGDRRAAHSSGEFHYTRDNYDFCEMFVMESALRIGLRDFRYWMPQTYGDWDRAKAAMGANGGRLPEDMQ
ncbi:hypothetical protein [Micromonospora fulviviridis]|uniref:hypothetical protein n=1 Tax=Micromonospora fulviviridis TaxID=47860 RepID=UPI0037A3234F